VQKRILRGNTPAETVKMPPFTFRFLPFTLHHLPVFVFTSQQISLDLLMDKQELIAKLNELGIPSNYYSLDGPFIDGIMLDHSVNHMANGGEYDVWDVFNHERGNRWNEKTFTSEQEAFEEIYSRFKKSKIG
jgi:hypothetical protein